MFINPTITSTFAQSCIARIPLVVGFFLLLFTANTDAENYREIGLPVVEVFGSQTHQGSNQNWFILQGNDGYIYNGTGWGINQWDGESWRIYSSPQRTLIRSISLWNDNRLYTGSMNDIGYYEADKLGRLVFTSLVEDWSFEQKQFGETWYTAANNDGVVFVTNKLILLWNGKTLEVVSENEDGNFRIFSLANSFIFKSPNNNNLQQIIINSDGTTSTVATSFSLPIDAKVQQIIADENNNMLVFTAKHGFFRQSGSSLQQISQASLFNQDKDVYHAIRASDGYYYIATLNSGIFILDKNLTPLRQMGEEHGLGSNKFYSLMEDRQGNIWASGVPDIIKFTPPHVYSHYVTGSNLANKLGLLQGKISIMSDGLFQLQASPSALLPPFFEQLLDDVSLGWDFVHHNDYLFYANRTGINARPISADGSLGDILHLISGETGKAFVVTKDGKNLYASTNNGLYKVHFSDGQPYANKVNAEKDEMIVLAAQDNGTIWAGTPTQELYRFIPENNEATSHSVTKYAAESGLPAGNIYPFIAKQGLLIGTYDGVMDFDETREPQLQFIKNRPSIFHTPGQDVFRMAEGHGNKLWYRIGGHTGYIFEDENGQWQADEATFKPFLLNGYKGFLSTSENILWFASAKGEVYRIDIQRLSSPPPLGILNIRSITNTESNELLFGGQGEVILPVLDQQNNSLRIEYALAENSDLKRAKYRHRLIGSENENWSRWSTEVYKDFTSLSGGDYTFEIEAKEGWQRVSQKAFNFSILPPWYLSKLALLCYISLFVLMVVLSGWLTQKWRTKQLQRRNLELQTQVDIKTAEITKKAEQLEAQQQLKERFFANISHEFRTPITLTVAPLQDILDSGIELNEKVKYGVTAAVNNARKMLSLISLVLDINRLDNNKFQLRIAQWDMAELVRHVCLRFAPLAIKNQQILDVSCPADPLLVYFDKEQVDRCVSNLIMNAIKYSGEGSLICVSLATKDQHVSLSVSDNGVGISEKEQHLVFERFFQGAASESVSEPGTGIGLSFVKEIMDLHHGEVSLESDSGESTTFTLRFKLGHEHFDKAVMLDLTQIAPQRHVSDVKLSDKYLHARTTIDKKDPNVTTLLVVDDNDDLREFIYRTLEPTYRVITAKNGKEALTLAVAELPDLIISDVMMPIMDGLQLTQKIKADPLTKTIPIILLTARATKRETVEGLDTGADDYLTKPFDTAELIARVNAILVSRKAFRKQLIASFMQPDNNGDFKQRLRSHVIANLSDPSFSIADLASLMSCTERTLRRNSQKELSMTLVQFITKIRMEIALQLLQTKNNRVSEVAYAVGYESLSYFSKVFKKHFGYPPTNI